jgi:hypothetical protein
MKAKSLERYPLPGYPTRPDIQHNPTLLRRSLSFPVRRLLETGISGTMALLVSLSGCDRNDGGPARPPISQPVEGQDPNTPKTAAGPKTKQTVFMVAPIFEHGEGRGAVGCVVSAPPAFLSGGEGLSVLQEELSKKGVQLERKKIVFKQIPMHKETWRRDKRPEFLETDLTQDNEQIIIEFISIDDYFELGGQHSMSTVQSFDFKKVSEQLRLELETKADRGIFGVFYDPMVKIDYSKSFQQRSNLPGKERWELIQNEAKTEAKGLLRQQAQDFAQWLADNKVK